MLKHQYVYKWRSLQIDLGSFHVSDKIFDNCIKKLKLGKGSPDGVTAEMYCAMPRSARPALASYMTSVLRSLSFPSSWFQTYASLVPKGVAANSLSKFRPLASLPAIRKLLGYIWLSMLAVLTFVSFQTGFI